MKKRIVHFGGGALGRGLVIPMETESGCEVVLVDTNRELIEALQADNSYPIDMTDLADGERTIPLAAVVDGRDREAVAQHLAEVDTVTTSVLRDNLVHVASTLAEAWGKSDCAGRQVICCENVENVGAHFREVLREAAGEERWKNLQTLCIPDVVVDRNCSASFPETLLLRTESFHECAVDAAVLPDTGIRQITSTDNIRGAFYRKRFLMNTYADATAFLGKEKGYHYLYEAVDDAEIYKRLAPYMDLLKQILIEEYGIAADEVSTWADCYRTRLTNPGIPRTLETVARNFWNKFTAEERFISPILQLLSRGESVQKGLPVLADLLRCGLPEEERGDRAALVTKLAGLWSGHAGGDALAEDICKLL